jgi:hypothetical protein
MQLQPSHYPWYGITSGPDIEQGDIFEDCSLFDPETTDLDDPASRAVFTWQTRDVIVMTQSCDLVPGRVKVDQVLVCVLWKLSDFPPQHLLASPKGLEEARRGNLPGFHMLASNSDDDFPREARLVDFRKTRSLPLKYLQQRSNKLHLRLLPPYREHLSQAFARYFMRVGLPIDIPPFR